MEYRRRETGGTVTGSNKAECLVDANCVIFACYLNLTVMPNGKPCLINLTRLDKY